MDSKHVSRRRVLTGSVALAGLAVGARFASGQSTRSVWTEGPETLATHPLAYGEPARFAQIVRTPMTHVGGGTPRGNPSALDALTPLGALKGTITPSALHYVSSHGSVPPDIDPANHRLLVYGMVDRPLEFTMDDLMRLPAVSRIHYLECAVNGGVSQGKTLEQMHGMVACSEWTGVPLSVLLDEVGVKSGASWVLAEGAEASKLAATHPLAKAMDDVLVAYAQNGEPVRPHQGYPLRLVVPGFQGKYHVKWLKRLKVVDRPYIGYWEKHSYTRNKSERHANPASPSAPFLDHVFGQEGAYTLEQGPKSVITFPSGENQLPSHGHYTISGLAWSGCGTVQRVEVSVDGGRSWTDAQIEAPVHRIALTHFTAPWTWNGGEAVLQSRCTDERGQVQPTAAEFPSVWGKSGAPHNNIIQPWRVTNGGTVLNAL